MHPSSTLHPPFTIKKKLILSKRGGQRKNEGKIFSISQHYFPYANAAHPCLNSFGLL
jgi:hypothetical protein